MKYRIVIGEHILELELMVNEFIKDGWKPIGGIAIDRENNGKFYSQAMIKKEN